MAQPQTKSETALQPGKYWTEQPLPQDDDLEDVASSTASIASSIMRYRTFNHRTYHNDHLTNTQYWGANDDRQNKMLDILHHAFTMAMDDKLHWAPLSPDIKAAVDIGTGTGIWAIDFGDEYPDCKVIGTDLSPIQPTWVPPNVHFQIDDFTQEWTFAPGSLDYVHLRWLLGTVTDWTELFRQAYRALKPGGWIESFDADAAYYSDDGSIQPGSPLQQWNQFFREGPKAAGIAASFNVASDGIQKKALEEAGFINIHEKSIKIPATPWPEDPKQREIGQFMKVAVGSDVDGVLNYAAIEWLGWKPEQVASFAANVRKAMRDPEIHPYNLFHNAWAQKPEAS